MRLADLDLPAAGHLIGVGEDARLMRAMGLTGVVRGRRVLTTVPEPAAVCPLDRVNRQFKAEPD